MFKEFQKDMGSVQKNSIFGILALVIFLQYQEIQAEMIIGTGSIEPGVDLIFEGGVKDDVMPNEYFLNEGETDVHIEVLANWSSKAPDGSPEGGHVAYLQVDVEIVNEQSGKSQSIQLKYYSMHMFI